MEQDPLSKTVPVVGINMWLESTRQTRTPNGFVYSVTVQGEAVSESWIGRNTFAAQGTAEGKSALGAMLLAYVACVRAFAAADHPSATFREDIEWLDQRK